MGLSWKLTSVAVCAAFASITTGTAAAQLPVPPGSLCGTLSPSAAPCTLAEKTAESLSAECRRLGFAAAQCTLPLGKEVTDAAVREYRESSLHRTLRFQRRLGDTLPLSATEFLGTHNSFNSAGASTTLSHSDSNQQLSLSQQLDIDIRSVELDVHYIPRAELGGASAVTVCHGRGPDEQHVGCTNEPLLKDVLPEISGWLADADNSDQVLMVYLEDELGAVQGYTDTVDQLESAFRRPDGSSRIYHPAATTGTCTNLPLEVSRKQIREAGAQVLLVGNCRAGWKSAVHGWDANHVEGGNTAAYKPFPSCDATYNRATYTTKLVRYFEDSTAVDTVVNPTDTEADHEARALTPERLRSMSDCGVNLYGFDQLLPGDGRLQATAWSWIADAPDPTDGPCAVQRTDGRWITTPCAERRPAACLTGTVWSLTAAVTWDQAAAACAAKGAQTAFATPRSGNENALLRQAAGTDAVWLAVRLGEATGATGASGTTGAAGADGATGTSGATGSTGATGANGTNGADGTNGANGADGKNGTNGADGTNGTNGADGANGADGKNGSNGTNGEQGRPGTPGADGRGAEGVAGPSGPAGADKRPGRDALLPSARPAVTCLRSGTGIRCRVSGVRGRRVAYTVHRAGRMVARGSVAVRSGRVAFRPRITAPRTGRFTITIRDGATVVRRAVRVPARRR